MLSLVLVLPGCTAGGEDSGTTIDSGTTVDSGDSGTVGLSGLKGREGSAVVGLELYAGQEEAFLVADEGDGEDVCRIGYDLENTGSPRTDCEECDFAFDLVLRNAAVLVSEEPDCLSLLGLKSDQVTDLDGTQVSYGYVADWIGHAEVLMMDLGDGEWEPVAYASLDPKTGEFSYAWNEGLVSY